MFRMFFGCILTCTLLFIGFEISFDKRFNDTFTALPMKLVYSREKREQRVFGIPEEFDHLIPENFTCSEFYSKNTSNIDHYAKERITVEREPLLSMTCDDIRRRVTDTRRFTKSKNTFAVARNIYQEYYLQEILLSFSYSPFNFYCYAIDVKSSREFSTKMRTLAGCLENVIVLYETFPFDSSGHYQHHGHFACMEKLLEKPNWKYVMLLQNSDVFIKTTEEISQIIENLNGAPFQAFTNAFKHRIPKNVPSWTANGTKLFKNESRRSKEQLNTPIVVRKSSNQAFLPRAFVKGVSLNLNLTIFLEIFNHKKTYGVDEMMIPTLLNAYFLKIPGQVENTCNVPDKLRYVHWNFGKAKNCKSKEKRHGVCFLGVEYLRVMNDSVQIIANKIWPEFDFGAVICLGEMLNQRSQNDKPKVDATFYKNLPQVKEIEEKI